MMISTYEFEKSCLHVIIRFEAGWLDIYLTSPNIQCSNEVDIVFQQVFTLKIGSFYFVATFNSNIRHNMHFSVLLINSSSP